MFHVVRGASYIKPEVIAEKDYRTYFTRAYEKCLLLLIFLGVDLNVPDIAGYTPLHYCSTNSGNEITLVLAEVLLKAGADVDAKNRLGETPLSIATLAYKYDVIQLLLDHGADPYVGANGCNVTPNDVAADFPRIQEMFSKAIKKQKKNDREKIKDTEGLKNCHVCKKQENGTKRCTGCYLVFYCSTSCQSNDWADHRDNCKLIQKEYKLCQVSSSYENPKVWYDKSFVSNLIQQKMKPKDIKKSHFVIKVNKSNLVFNIYVCNK